MELRPLCLVCGSPGGLVHENVPDSLCGSPDQYNYLSCADCRMLWVSPRPDPSSLVKLYERHYGDLQLAPDPDLPAAGAKAWVRAVVLNSCRGYPAESVPRRRVLGHYAGPVLARIPWVGSRAQFGLGLMLPPFRPRGRLLDLGCGYGWFVRLLRGLGWDAMGVEADRTAVAAGRARYGVPICEGTLEEQAFPDASFDALVTRHSIEHVPDPRQTLLECRRVLKPGGWLGVATPNGRSLSSRLFGRHWRGLTPPWHLHLFGPQALRRLVEESGFAVQRIRTTAVSAHWVFCASRAIKRGEYGPGVQVGSSRLFQACEAIGNAWWADLGEELELTAVATNATGPARAD